MNVYAITHPHAIEAVWLAYKLRGAASETITARLAASGCPRSLFVLASVLQAATRPGAIINEEA